MLLCCVCGLLPLCINRFTGQDSSLLRCDCHWTVIFDVSKGEAVLEFYAEVPLLWLPCNALCVLLVAY